MISFCIPTIRPEHGAYVDGFEDKHLFEPFVETLYPRLDEEIELVISDGLKSHRDLEKFFEPFNDKIKVKVIEQKSWWLTNGFPSFSKCWNDAAKASSGDYLVFLSDCVSFPPHFFLKLKEKRDERMTSQFLYLAKKGDFLLDQNCGISGYRTKGEVLDAFGGSWLNCVYESDPRWRHFPWGDKTVLRTFREIHWQHCLGFFSL